MPIGSGGGGGGTPFTGGTIPGPLVVDDGGSNVRIELNSDDSSGAIIVDDLGNGPVADIHVRAPGSSETHITENGVFVTDLSALIFHAQILQNYALWHYNAAPADVALSPGDFALWLDATPGATKLMVKAQDSGGTVRTASISLS